MAIDLITGHQGVAHISAEQIAELQRAELGGYGDNKVMRMIDGGVTYAGLTITVAAGYWRVNGYDMQIQEAEEILIDPTAAGMSRIDKVYAAILQDIPSGVQRSELRVVQGEESASTPTAPTKPTAPILNTDELLQIEEVCTVTVSDGAMTFTDNTIPYELANPEDITDTQEMIAPIEAGPTASKAYAVGKQLIYNGLLYKVTAAIAQEDTLTVDTNIELSDDVVTQLETLTKNAPKYGTSSSSASTTAKTATTTNGDFNLHTGSVVRVKFTYTNTATTPTLNVDSTGAHAIKAYNTTKPDVYWKAGDVVEFTYDGSYFIMSATEGQITDLNASLTNQNSYTATLSNALNGTVTIPMASKPNKFLLFVSARESDNSVLWVVYGDSSTNKCKLLFTDYSGIDERTIGASNNIVNAVSSSGVTLKAYTSGLQGRGVLLVVIS